MTDISDSTRRRNRLLREHAFDALYRDETGSSLSCRDCGVRFAAKPWYRVRTVGHNIPLARVGASESRELVKYDQCAGCNAEQGTRTPEEWRADRQAARSEPIGEITDDQKRIRERVRWEKQWRRRRPARDRPGLGEVPAHLRSHEEVFALALAGAKAEIARLPAVIEQREKDLADKERTLAYLRTQPPVVRHLFGLIIRPDRKIAAAIASTEESVDDERRLLDEDAERLSNAETILRQLKSDGRLSDCPCVVCVGDYDDRSERYREDRASDRKAAWYARRSPRTQPRGGNRRSSWPTG